MPSLPFVRRPRGPQLPTGAPVTLTLPIPTASSLNTDPSHSGTIPGLATPTLTVTSSSSPSATSSSTNQPTNSLSTPAIIGLAVGIFAFLAVSLVIFMVVLNNRRNRRKSGSHVKKSGGSKPKPQASRPPTDPADESFLSLNFSRSALPQSRAPARSQRGMSVMTSIPNPFSASTTSSQESALTSSSQIHAQSNVLVPTTLSTGDLSAHTPQYTHMQTSSAAVSSISNNPEAPVLSENRQNSSINESQEVSSMRNDITRASSMVDYREVFTVYNAEYPANQAQSASLKSEKNQSKIDTDPTQPPLSKTDQKAARARELKAMQNLISALDSPNASSASIPTSSGFMLQVDTAASTGKSRLSMGEGIVTPGGGNVNTSSSGSPLEGDSSPLPPADIFRAALGFEEHRER